MLKRTLWTLILTVAGSGLIGACSGPDEAPCRTCAQDTARGIPQTLEWCSPLEEVAEGLLRECMMDHLIECATPTAQCVPHSESLTIPESCRICLLIHGCEKQMQLCGI